MTPAENTRIWRKTRRQALRGIPTGRRASHHPRTANGRQQQATSAADSGRPAEAIQTARERARLAWVTAPKETELDRWRELYDLVVPRPYPDERSAA